MNGKLKNLIYIRNVAEALISLVDANYYLYLDKYYYILYSRLTNYGFKMHNIRIAYNYYNGYEERLIYI